MAGSPIERVFSWRARRADARSPRPGARTRARARSRRGRRAGMTRDELDHLDEGLDHDGVELAARHATELGQRSLRADRSSVGVARCHDVVCVRSGDDARAERDLLERHVVVAIAVVALVVAVDDVRHRAVAVDPPHEPCALLGVHLHDAPLLVGELAVGEQDRVREDELADVVQERRGVDQILLAIVEPEHLRHLARERATAAECRAVIGSRIESVCMTVLSNPTCSAASSRERLPSSSPRSNAAIPARSRYWKTKRTTARSPTAPTPIRPYENATPAVSNPVANCTGRTVMNAARASASDGVPNEAR